MGSNAADLHSRPSSSSSQLSSGSSNQLALAHTQPASGASGQREEGATKADLSEFNSGLQVRTPSKVEPPPPQ